MKKTLFRTASATAAVAALVACSSNGERSPESAVQSVRQAFDCNDPSQRFVCNDPDNTNKRFVCHATGSASNPYVKISVPIGSSAHTPFVAHGNQSAADQSPGASGIDLGAGLGLDCECNPRVCLGTCSGSAAGAGCDDGDKCTGEGSCSGDTC